MQEQDKQRSTDKKKEEVEKKGLERKKEEVDEVQKLHVRLKQEQQRWDKECLAREKHQVHLMLMLRVAYTLICLTSFGFSVCLCCSLNKKNVVMHTEDLPMSLICSSF